MTPSSMSSTAHENSSIGQTVYFRPDPGVVDVADPQENAVPERRVGVGHIGPQAEDRLARAVDVAEHLLPLLERFGNGLGALGAGAARDAVLPEELLRATADVGTALLDDPTGPRIERRDPVRLVVDGVRTDSGELAVAEDEVEELGLDPLRRGPDRVVEDE